MKIFCPVWGRKYISLLQEALGESLSWPKNNASIKGAEWIFTVSDQAEVSQIKEIALQIDPLSQHKFFVCDALKNPQVDSGMVLIEVLKHTISACLEENTPLLMATPDFIYGDGTIDAFKAVTKEPGSCASIAHLRVWPDILGFLPDQPSNEELTGLAFEYAHQSFAESPANLYKGGLEKIFISPKLYAIRHYMPSPFFVNFLPKDLEHFNEVHEGKPPGFGMWDHVWPTHLLHEARLRYIGSSDVAMMIEITDKDKNVPPMNDTGEVGFFRNHFHNRLQSQFISVFRGI